MTAKRYEFMTINQLAHAVCDAANGTEFTFTFDTKESLAQNGEPTGWYGAKIIDIFGEEKGTLNYAFFESILLRFRDLLDQRGLRLTSEDFSSSGADRSRLSNLILEAANN